MPQRYWILPIEVGTGRYTQARAVGYSTSTVYLRVHTSTTQAPFFENPSGSIRQFSFVFFYYLLQDRSEDGVFYRYSGTNRLRRRYGLRTVLASVRFAPCRRGIRASGHLHRGCCHW